LHAGSYRNQSPTESAKTDSDRVSPMRQIVAATYRGLCVLSVTVALNRWGLATRPAGGVGQGSEDWGLTAEAMRWYAAQLALVGAAVAGLGFDIPPLAIAAAAILLPAVFISWWVGFIRRIRQGRLFSFPGRIPEIVSWLLGTRAPDWWRIASGAALGKRSELSPRT